MVSTTSRSRRWIWTWFGSYSTSRRSALDVGLGDASVQRGAGALHVWVLPTLLQSGRMGADGRCVVRTLPEQFEGRFDVVGESEADSRGRVALGRAGARPGRRYQVRSDDDGVIVLMPVVSIPEREMLAWENPRL